MGKEQQRRERGPQGDVEGMIDRQAVEPLRFRPIPPAPLGPAIREPARSEDEPEDGDERDGKGHGARRVLLSLL